MFQIESMELTSVSFYTGHILPLDKKAQGKRECQENAYSVERNACIISHGHTDLSANNSSREFNRFAISRENGALS